MKRATRPSILLVTGLQDMGAKLRAFDPAGMGTGQVRPSNIHCEDAHDCARGADALVIVTEWVQFRALDLNRLKQDLAQPIIVDLPNVHRREDMEAHGFTYTSVVANKAFRMLQV